MNGFGMASTIFETHKRIQEEAKKGEVEGTLQPY